MYRYHTSRQGLVPLGDRSLCSSLLKISSTTRDRAVKANLVEIIRTKKLQSIFDQQKKENDILTSRVINRTMKTLKENSAFQYVLKTEYPVPRFETLQHGFKTRGALTPKTLHHVQVETKVYNAGFDKSIFTPEIYRRLAETSPKRRKELERRLLLNRSRKLSQITIDRNISNSDFFKMLQDRNSIKNFKYQRKPTKLRFRLETPSSSMETTTTDATKTD